MFSILQNVFLPGQEGVRPKCGDVWGVFLSPRHIQDPASQRLTWNKPPKSVLVIKKIRDASLLQPFKELCMYLTEVRKYKLHLSSLQLLILCRICANKSLYRLPLGVLEFVQKLRSSMKLKNKTIKVKTSIPFAVLNYRNGI